MGFVKWSLLGYLLLLCALPEEHSSLDPGKLLPKETQTSKRAEERNLILGYDVKGCKMKTGRYHV